MNPGSSVIEAPSEEQMDAIPVAMRRCPYWLRYTQISPLRRLLEPAAKLLSPHVEPGMTVLEPRGHVKAEHFETMMESCRRAGFTEVERPDVGRKRLAALLAAHSQT